VRFSHVRDMAAFLCDALVRFFFFEPSYAERIVIDGAPFFPTLIKEKNSEGTPPILSPFPLCSW